MAPETLDTITDFLANGDKRCPAAVDKVIRQGLPMTLPWVLTPTMQMCVNKIFVLLIWGRESIIKGNGSRPCFFHFFNERIQK